MASTNNVLNNALSTSIKSAVETFTISNSDNTGTSAAQMIISVGGGTTTGDPQESYIITGANTWSIGADNSISDQFTVAHNAALGTSNMFVSSTTGVNSFPLQPCFLAIPTGNQTNATGNGSTAYTLGTTVGMTKIFDQGTNFSGVTFTAPVAGQYLFLGSATITNCLVSTGVQIQIIVSGTGKSAVKTLLRPASAADASINICYITSLQATATAVCKVSALGEATNRNTVVGGTSSVVSFFAGYLMC